MYGVIKEVDMRYFASQSQDSFPTAGRVVCFSRWLTSSSRCFFGILPVMVCSSVQASSFLELGFLALFSSGVRKARTFCEFQWSEFKIKAGCPLPRRTGTVFWCLISWPGFQSTFHDLI
ncbi:hypothetical protein J6590_030443 [Homalodisca vitripennis]|nr:hypothetical protein J6590_030443 [Homalodisca vitripennis]